MPLLIVHYRNFNPAGSPSTDDRLYATQKIRMSSLSVPMQKLSLVGYCINLRKHATLAGGASHAIPDHVLVEIDEITTQQINNVSPPKTHNGNDFVQTHSIPLPLTDNLNTIHFGMSGLNFDVNKRMNRELTVSIKKFNDNNEIVPMTTSTNDSGQVSIDHLLLYFNYDRVANF